MKNFKSFILMSCFLSLQACAAPLAKNFNTLANTQPYVLQISPEPYQVLESIESIQIVLAHPINPESLDENSLYVARGEIPVESIQDENIAKVSGSTTLSEDLTTITWKSEETLQDGDYTLVIETDLEGENHQPFNQNPGEDPQAFVAAFYLGTGSRPDPASASSPSSSPPRENLHPPLNLVINEILYDANGSDTDGNEFIELYGTPDADIDGYQILIINGGDGEIIDTIHLPNNSKMNSNGLFLIADARTNASKASNIPHPDFIDNFDPQNGPDVIQVMDAQGQITDTLCYGNGSLPIARNGFESCEESAASDVSGGHSLSRLNGADSQNNSVDFIDLSTPTPGEL